MPRGLTVPKGLENERSNDATGSTANLLAVLSNSRTWLKNNKPVLNQAELDDMVRPPSLDNVWTLADQTSIENAWTNDPMRLHLLTPGGNISMGPVLRYSTRYFGMFPEEVIGEQFGLAYDVAQNEKTIQVNGQEIKHPYWRSDFCKALLPLFSHEMWQLRPGRMCTSLQYVVKCLKNDQRQVRWPPTNYTTDKFFDVWADVTSTFQNGNRTMVELHDEVIRRLHGEPSPWSRLFREIEAVAFNAEVEPLRSPPVPDAAVPPYLVSTKELRRLTTALNNQLTELGFPACRTGDFMNKVASAATGTQELPKGEDIETFRAKALLSMRLKKAKAAKLASVAVPPPRAPSPRAPSSTPPMSRAPTPPAPSSRHPTPRAQSPRAPTPIPRVPGPIPRVRSPAPAFTAPGAPMIEPDGFPAPSLETDPVASLLNQDDFMDFDYHNDTPQPLAETSPRLSEDQQDGYMEFDQPQPPSEASFQSSENQREDQEVRPQELTPPRRRTSIKGMARRSVTDLPTDIRGDFPPQSVRIPQSVWVDRKDLGELWEPNSF